MVKLQRDLERVGAEKAALESGAVVERQRLEAKVAELEKAGAAERKRAEEAESKAKGPAAEVVKLQRDLERVGAEKAALESGSAAERQRLEAKVAELEKTGAAERKRAEEAEAAAKTSAAKSMSLRAEAERSSSNKKAPEKVAQQERRQLDEKLAEAQKTRDAAIVSLEEARREAEELRVLVKQLSDENAAHSEGTNKGDESLRQILVQQDEELRKLRLQVSLADGHGFIGESLPEGPRVASRKREIVLGATLVGGVVAGLLFGGLLFHSKEEGTVASVSPSSSVSTASPPPAPAVSSPAQPAKPAGKAADAPAPRPPETVSAPAPGAPAPAPPTFSAGMPAKLPDSFLGIRFGSPLSEIPGRAQWQETQGKRHRKAELLNAPVEAVLSQDDQGRFIMGSYVRVVPRQAEAITPFLEWAVNAQDAVSALYGEPSQIHQVQDASDAAEVVRKIVSAEDYYQATWEREGEDTMMDLSIRVFNERTVVFRLEYRSRELSIAFAAKQSAGTQTSSPEAPAPNPPEDK